MKITELVLQHVSKITFICRPDAFEMYFITVKSKKKRLACATESVELCGSTSASNSEYWQLLGVFSRSC